MDRLNGSPENLLSNTGAAKRLARAIMLAQGEFALILACYKTAKSQQQIVDLLKEYSSADIQEIFLSPQAQTLYTTITSTIGASQPEALIIRGLESVTAINQVIISTNLMRDEFRKAFKFPLVLLIDDEVLRKLVWLAPDLKNWAANTIKFDVFNQQLIESTALSA